ncbi:TPA: terminase large subunit [Staphylococcus pseudintermedius]|uniref:terminase TerL endonuclease subunit n=1 Tax=Staphylococcus pseudintermedius TaxID=283734 RepID=UPI00129D522C|nr:terminase TerL endonuclease subunit [Staphylococcus pseudintermedius]EGQ1613722.1 terminase large subunit [Staphylococcus pseudintermedius]EGQ2688383.1 terminase large subunit [Staphylococcus pseudintermedius]EGQ3594672.1 terminase large subunit [Staphylococcus pseudintermedius]EHT3659284.1 terminase large subunit [Staphylococcus pseudintermedius]EJF1310939.1 terminase large subunit [Staphylococcus pseudintermedius]
MIRNVHVDEYIEMWKSGKIILNKERILLIAYIEKYILSRDDLYFDEVQIENFIKFTEKWYFPLQPFQKFIIPFIFLFEKEGDFLYYEQFFITLGRGGGKNGLITALSNYFISYLHGVPNYDISVVANSEDQAKTSFEEAYNMIEKNKLEDVFHKTKSVITDIETKSRFRFRTSNAGTKDGGREGCVIYDEVHRFEDSETVDVFSSGLGKVKWPREFFIGTDGYVRDGFLDKLKERSMSILNGETPDDRLFPFICKLDDASEVENSEMWEKANPMFSKPMSHYAKGLFRKVKNQYNEMSFSPTKRQEFMTKRMNLPEVDLEKVVAPWEEILATNRPLPELERKQCIGGLDYASIKDFAAVGLLFRDGENYIWKSHSFVRKGFLDTVKLKAPIHEWEKQGLLTIVDEPSIDPLRIVIWFDKMRETYGLEKVVADNFRMDLLRPYFEKYDIEIEVIKNPKAIQSLLAPRIETMFAQHRIVFGDDPLMRWYTNNVAVKIKPDGNKEYIKKDEVRRKTDGFQALVHALFRADELLEVDINESLDFLNAIDF